MERRGWKSTAAYAGWLTGAFALAMTGSWLFGAALDNSIYDEMFRIYRPAPWQRESALLVVDDRSLPAIPDGLRGIRKPLADALRVVASARPKAVAVDFILSTPGSDPAVDADLASAFRSIPNLVISSQLLPDGFEDPLPQFAQAATAVGHVHAQPADEGVTRSISLEKHYGHKRLWALALETFRVSRNAAVQESTDTRDLQVGDTRIPVNGDDRLMRIRFAPPGLPITRVSLKELRENLSLASRFAGKTVFVGVTSQTEHDEQFTPYSRGIPMPGVEIHANAFETMAQRLFITDVPDIWVVLFAAALVAAAGLAFRYLPGWGAYLAGALILLAGSATPYIFFTHRRVFSFTTSAGAAWFGTLTAASYYYFVVRRNLLRSEAERARYQQAMHFVTHEMRTPLSAIQGSSELISKYALTEEKKQQLSLLINSESKRLARMVEIFLNVERLSAGQMELKRELIPVKAMIEICITRVLPLAERKHIGIALDPIADQLQVTGDRELMEYACYNLLTNAVKYSPQRTEVTVSGIQNGTLVRISVKDHGIGMDQKEVKQIFRKFYRTRKAEESGEAGTGIGLSIVQQIVEQHGGRIDVTSQPGRGSCFTLVLPAAAHAAVPTSSERN